jgi:hypothetical protein
MGGYRQINKSLNICVFQDFLESQWESLPELEDVSQVTPRVLRVLGQNSGKVSASDPKRISSTDLIESI